MPKGKIQTYPEVSPGKGAEFSFSIPQKLLDGLIGGLSFDPLEFACSEKKEQRDILMLVSKMKVDWQELKSLTGRDWSDYGNFMDAIDAATKFTFDSRIEINRRVKLLAHQLGAIKIPDEFKDAKPISMKKLLDQQKDINSLRALNETIKHTEKGIKDLNMELHRLHQQRWILQSKDVDIKNEKAIGEKVTRVDEINEYARLAENKKGLMKDHTESMNTLEKFTRSIEKLRQLKTDVMAKSKLPIKDLGFSEDGVTFKELPFEQTSDSEKLKVSMAIAMALNSKIRVILIRDKSLLDKDSMKIIEQMVEDQGFRVWGESVSDEPGKVGIFISEGKVVAIDGKGVKKL